MGTVVGIRGNRGSFDSGFRCGDTGEEEGDGEGEAICLEE